MCAVHLLDPARLNPYPVPTPQAIDLVDEAAAKLKMEITSKPLALDELDRKVLGGCPADDLLQLSVLLRQWG
jgi:hypothetical protein